MTAEHDRLAQAPTDGSPWKIWGPYVAGRQWGTVREDYSADGNAWDYFPFDHSHRRAYRWGEDGLGAICDRFGFFNLGIALWNGHDDRLKERYFGLTNAQGNHGEDVKEVWWALDGTPTHSYMSWLYRYPQAAFPYADLLAGSASRDRDQPEFELTDTGVMGEDRFFDVQVDYAKGGPTDIVMRVTVTNHGPDATPLDLLVQGWFRKTWGWGRDERTPTMSKVGDAVEFHHDWLGHYQLSADQQPRIMFCDNETDPSLFEGSPDHSCPKNGFDQAVVHGDDHYTRADQGTKVAYWWHFEEIAPGGQQVRTVRLTAVGPATGEAAAPFVPATGEAADHILDTRRGEADEFYNAVIPADTSHEDRLIARRAFAGLLWGKQLYRYSVAEWLDGDPSEPTPPPQRRTGRNSAWTHLDLADIISMPDEWEYPWFATWDLAFHTVSLAHVDAEFAKCQLELMCWEWAQHPNGQLPAYEWDFNDVNPPVHAWAAMQVFSVCGGEDQEFLVRIFTKLLMNFSWWINRKDPDGSYLFEGGFLGMDNIGFFDRSLPPLPSGLRLEQSDATSWVAFYALSMMRIAIELARQGFAGFDSTARTFFEYFLRLAGAMDNFGSQGISLWSEHDGYYYDAVVSQDGSYQQIPLRSLAGLLPLIAIQSIHPAVRDQLPGLLDEVRWIARRDPQLADVFVHHETDGEGRVTLALVGDERRHRIFRYLFDESELLSPNGIRSLSRAYEQPFTIDLDGQTFTIEYCAAESRSAMFGGNSNWRGPVWMPVNLLLLDSVRRYAAAQPDVQVEFPTGSGTQVGLATVADDLRERLIGLFRPRGDGRRPGTPGWYPSGPLWDEHPTFCEYFDGDDGSGLGATHQTGWTALVAHLICAPDGFVD